MAVKFINFTKEEFLSKNAIYKYMPLEFALDSLKEKYLWFANPTVWKDPFEKRFIDEEYKKDNIVIKYPLKGKIFCTCMTQTRTSEAYWNVYNGGKLGASFTLSRDRLLVVLNEFSKENNCDVYIGKVMYLHTPEIKKNHLSEVSVFGNDFKWNKETQIKLLLLKRIAFEYENEIRIIVVKSNKTKEDGIKLPYKLDTKELVRRVTLDPNIGKNLQEILVNYIDNNYGIKQIYKSSIYTTPKSRIIEIK